MHVFNVVLQVIMLVGLLSILFLLIMPTIKGFQNNSELVERKSVLEISDSLAHRQRLTIIRANMLLTHSTAVCVEVVAIGKGIGLLFHDSPLKHEIRSLMDKGVVFTVCQRSLRQIEQKLAHSVAVLPGVQMVENGYRYAEELKDKGYLDEFA